MFFLLSWPFGPVLSQTRDSHIHLTTENLCMCNAETTARQLKKQKDESLWTAKKYKHLGTFLLIDFYRGAPHGSGSTFLLKNGDCD